MKNINIICIEEVVVPWSAPNETRNISESRENNSNVIPGHIMMNTGLHKFIKAMSALAITERVLANAVNRNSGSLMASDSKFQCSKQNCCRNIDCSSSRDNTLKRYQDEYFLN